MRTAIQSGQPPAEAPAYIAGELLDRIGPGSRSASPGYAVHILLIEPLQGT